MSRFRNFYTVGWLGRILFLAKRLRMGVCFLALFLVMQIGAAGGEIAVPPAEEMLKTAEVVAVVRMEQAASGSWEIVVSEPLKGPWQSQDRVALSSPFGPTQFSLDSLFKTVGKEPFVFVGRLDKATGAALPVFGLASAWPQGAKIEGNLGQGAAACAVYAKNVILLQAFESGGVWALDEAGLRTLQPLPAKDVEQMAERWAKACTAPDVRASASAALANLALGSDAPALAAHAALIRTLGRPLEPEFTQVVLERLAAAEDPEARGALLHLLRDAGPEAVKTILPLLADRRPAEDLAALSQKAPKLCEALANGAVAFRVCDVAFNVVHEIRKKDAGGEFRLTRSLSLEARDAMIRQAAD
ncbi:MAG TPA: hypothetical protein VGE29_00990 [Prosthecobacter sp.]